MTPTSFVRAALSLSLIALLAGCGEEEPTIDRVGVNVVDKALFEGSWYMSRTVIDVDYEGAALGTFPGDAASDFAQTFTAMPRIRWVIDEEFLFAYRDYELTQGGDGQLRGPDGESHSEQDLLGQPVAVFRIEKHFDIRRAYNTATGEERNVLVENSTDKRWYEREFMRVDWSRNLLPGYFGQTYNLNALLGVWSRESAELFVQDASAFPDSWQPRFDRMACDTSADEAEACTQAQRDLADDYAQDELYHMSFVTQEVLSPGTVPDPITGNPTNWCTAVLYSDAPACSSLVSHVRTSFLKVSDKRQYQPVNWVDSRFDRFGYFRLEQDTYDRSTDADDPAFFYTDFLNYNVNRHNIWKQWFDEDGEPLPYDERQVRQIVWYTTPELPAHLVQPSFDVVAQWNEVMMETVRRLRGEDPAQYAEVECQTDNPDGYCYCQTDDDGQVLQPTCPGQYDPFTDPDDYDGAVDPYDCHVEVPEDAEPDMNDLALGDKDFYGWYGARFVGDECVTVLRMNACTRASIEENGGTVEGLDCEERGDLRFKFLSYVDQPGTGFLGIATLRGDPVTGEILTGDANIGGPALDSFRTSALQTYDLINGTLDERELITGENVRSYFENLGHVDQPAQPRTDFSVAMRSDAPMSASAQSARAEIDSRMDLAMSRIERLQGAEGRANIYSDRGQKLIGTDLERRLSSGVEAYVAAGLDQLPHGADSTDVTEAMLDRISPLRNDIHSQLEEIRASEDRLSRANVMMPNEYVDDSVQWFVNKHADWPRARLEFTVNRLLYRQTQLHELGHCLGLRHDFGSSADSEHYHPEYYQIVDRYPLPNPEEYDQDGTPGLSATEQAAFDQAFTEVRESRELAGIDGAMNSSVMEYSANWYQRLQPLGLYDRAAIAYGYGDLVEAYDGPVAHDTARDTFMNYQGGQECESDSDCPYSEDGELSRFLLDENYAAGLTQRCVPSERGSTRMCSSFDHDVVFRAEEGGDHQPLTYRFCSDSRADTTLGWCNRFDEGDTYRDIVRNIADDYERMYLFSAFRRYRKGFSISGYRSSLLGRRLGVLQNIYQNMIFQYTSNPDYRQQLGSFGFYDQFLATTDILNFYARIMTTPNVGGYRYNDQTGLYQRAYIEPEAQEADLPVPLGLGRYFNSDYQAGLSGIERIERVGSFFEKVWVIQLLTVRGWQPDYTRDVAFYTNFYDLFPNEMQQIFNGMIRGFPDAYMPRLTCADGSFPQCEEPRLIYMDFYRGDCSNEDTCRPNPAEVTYGGMPVIDGGGSLSLQIYAALYGLQDFPVFFDTSFQNQLFICIEGSGDCVEPDPDAVEGEDYVRYTSDRYRRSFLAWAVEPAVGVGEQESIGFAMVKEARDLSTTLQILLRLAEADADLSALSQEDQDTLADIGYDPPDDPLGVASEIARIDNRVVNLESFFNQIIELERDLGIQDFRYWR
ncbi:MAG: hypothetical protein OXT09_35580 [Myxococcales bacterium]|nr:hypothetical protein [Myxococcales bacterium]